MEVESNVKNILFSVSLMKSPIDLGKLCSRSGVTNIKKETSFFVVLHPLLLQTWQSCAVERFLLLCFWLIV